MIHIRLGLSVELEDGVLFHRLSIAMFAIVIRSSMDKWVVPGPSNCIARIRRAVKADFTDAMKDHILGHHARPEFAFQPEMHRFGNLQQQTGPCPSQNPASVLPIPVANSLNAPPCRYANPSRTGFRPGACALSAAAPVWHTPAKLETVLPLQRPFRRVKDPMSIRVVDHS